MNDGELTIDEALEQQTPKKVQDELDSLRTALQRLQDERHYIAPVRMKGNTLRFAVAGDLHAGSLYERFDALLAFYDLLKSEKIRLMLIPGDLLDGHGMYRGQEFEQYAHGIKRQLAALKEKYPSSDIEHLFITGNHDYSFDKQVDVGIGERIAREMGWKFVGRDQAMVPLKTEDGQTYKIGLYHPDGGTAYALSYKSQKIVESIPGGKKPNMLFIGHYHKAEWIPRYRNVEVFQSGAFQSQTPYMARKGTPAHVGGWIVEVVLSKKKEKSSRVRAEFISFYEPEDTAT
jgi:predicted MPP superfamily phosphohydrolase